MVRKEPTLYSLPVIDSYSMRDLWRERRAKVDEADEEEAGLLRGASTMGSCASIEWAARDQLASRNNPEIGSFIMNVLCVRRTS